ncbi:hypothetical protein SAMN02745246_02617 [Leeuwenhoekiella marinoflava DSM 3653]|uniref:Uncharacterized protein n=2 Tax=Leeuwenhoekiella marinoflava TaxID=988 RepID=A0A4Q0PKT4_9FLAO|nr:hypothetical protein DSL99_2326 [Leeuwenhoekiella marinoflava]SHF47648.1 hypothetical protein SAMN02745246_02617 [Leeuwenhoekiella marinoflava DSM 3653]
MSQSNKNTENPDSKKLLLLGIAFIIGYLIFSNWDALKSWLIF